MKRLDVAGRRLVVLAAPGDRRDEDIADIGRIAAGHFDRYICRRDDQLRGRRPDEVPQLLRDALLANGVPAEQILVVPDEQAAVDTALREARAGRPAPDLRRQDHPDLEAGDPVPAGRCFPGGRADPAVAAGARRCRSQPSAAKTIGGSSCGTLAG